MLKKYLVVISVVAVMLSVSVGVSAHWVDDYVPSQVQSQLQSLELDREISRGQFCRDLFDLYRIVNGRDMEQGGLYVAPFSDTQDQVPYILATQGIVNGMSEGIFAPNATLTRAQCVAMVKRAMAPTRTGNGNGSFPDTQSHWAGPEIAWAAENSVVCGFPDGYFYPDQELTVAQARKILFLAQQQFGWIGVTAFSGGSDSGYNTGSFSPTPQQGQGYTNPDGTWNSSYNNGYNSNYYDNSGFGQSPGYNNNDRSFSSTPANGGDGTGYTPPSPTQGGGF